MSLSLSVCKDYVCCIMCIPGWSKFFTSLQNLWLAITIMWASTILGLESESGKRTWSPVYSLDRQLNSFSLVGGKIQRTINEIDRKNEKDLIRFIMELLSWVSFAVKPSINVSALVMGKWSWSRCTIYNNVTNLLLKILIKYSNLLILHISGFWFLSRQSL